MIRLFYAPRGWRSKRVKSGGTQDCGFLAADAQAKSLSDYQVDRMRYLEAKRHLQPPGARIIDTPFLGLVWFHPSPCPIDNCRCKWDVCL